MPVNKLLIQENISQLSSYLLLAQGLMQSPSVHQLGQLQDYLENAVATWLSISPVLGEAFANNEIFINVNRLNSAMNKLNKGYALTSYLILIKIALETTAPPGQGQAFIKGGSQTFILVHGRQQLGKERSR